MINKRNELGQSITNDDDIVKQRIELKYSKYEYVGGYTGSDGYLYLRCKDCGTIKRHNAQITKPSRRAFIDCPVCNSISKQYQKDIKKEKARIKRQEQRLLNIKPKQAVMKACPVCNKIFTGNNKSKYCSAKCGYYIGRKHHDDKRIRRMASKGDASISIKGLIARQGNLCAICGKPVDIYDYEKRGCIFIAGNYYPSIDHVIPLARGGRHQWDNVQLAHRICNTMKSDKIV